MEVIPVLSRKEGSRISAQKSTRSPLRTSVYLFFSLLRARRACAIARDKGITCRFSEGAPAISQREGTQGTLADFPDRSARAPCVKKKTAREGGCTLLPGTKAHQRRSPSPSASFAFGACGGRRSAPDLHSHFSPPSVSIKSGRSQAIVTEAS